MALHLSEGLGRTGEAPLLFLNVTAWILATQERACKLCVCERCGGLEPDAADRRACVALTNMMPSVVFTVDAALTDLAQDLLFVRPNVRAKRATMV